MSCGFFSQDQYETRSILGVRANAEDASGSLKMSQEALAARSGYERAFISLIQLGKTNPSLKRIFDICGLIQMKPSAFLRQVEQVSGFELPTEAE